MLLKTVSQEASASSMNLLTSRSDSLLKDRYMGLTFGPVQSCYASRLSFTILQKKIFMQIEGRKVLQISWRNGD